jgi:predicted O-methyltransferase YrrM
MSLSCRYAENDAPGTLARSLIFRYAATHLCNYVSRRSLLLKKLWSANDSRKSRFHDRHGHLIAPARILLNFPRAVASALRLKMTGKRAPRPWISYAVVELLKKELSERPCDVLEFGSGMSTLWFASRAKRVFSVEHDPVWYAQVQQELSLLGHASAEVVYQLADDRTSYSTFKATTSDCFDIILIDGPWRADCLLHHMTKIKNGGIIYVDNTDAESSSGEPGEISLAVDRLRAFATARHGSIQRYTDFAPGCVFATEGYLVRLPK